MSPDRRPGSGRKPKRSRSSEASARTSKVGPGASDAYDIVYFGRHLEDDAGTSVPGREFIQRIPDSVRRVMQAVLVEVAQAPPHRFSGGGYWEAMHGDMNGLYEIRKDGPKRHHYRLFCILDTDAIGYGPLLVVIAGLDKPFKTTLSDAEYKQVRSFRDEYLSRNPRSIT